MSKDARRSAALDCVRMVAIVAVIFFHASLYYDPADFSVLSRLMNEYGQFGVEVFYPLSGFLICRYLLEPPRPGWITAFFSRRFFRIVPIYMVAVTAFLCAMLVVGHETHLVERIWIPYAMLTGWMILIDGRETVPYTITWSISVEVFAYLVIGVLAALGRRWLIWGLVALTLAPIGLRLHLHIHELGNYYFFPPARLDAVAIGGLLAYLTARGGPVWTFIAIGLALSIYAGRVGGLTAAALYYLAAPFVGCALIALADRFGERLSGGLARLSASIGFHSYFIYLFHYMALEALMIGSRAIWGAPPNFWLAAILTTGATYAAAAASYRLFEGPLIRYGRAQEGDLHQALRGWRERLFPRIRQRGSK